MTTPIVDFIREYNSKKPLRLHTPGHKGKGFSGFYKYDITECCGADELFVSSGIIAESEKNASEIFGTPTYYSAEGSSLCVRAMLYLIAQRCGGKPVIVAARNAHKSFLYGAALVGAEVIWLPPHKNDTYVSCTVTAEDVGRALSDNKADAVFITTPDYLGKTTDIKEISAVCKKHGVILAVDCAHGAYLHFTGNPSYPTDSGADLCCSSAHKTLPALTGAAYLHVNCGIPADEVKASMSAFASTSPSYLILASLDRLNPYLPTLKKRLKTFIPQVERAKKALCEAGYTLYGDEPLKITLDAAEYGYSGFEIEQFLIKNNIYPEYADGDYITFMVSTETGRQGLDILRSALLKLPKRDRKEKNLPRLILPQKAVSIRDAFFAAKESLPTEFCAGRVLSDMNVSCPPAVCPVVCGEIIDEKMIPYLKSIGIDRLSVVR